MRISGATVEINGTEKVQWDGKVVKCESCGAWIGLGVAEDGTRRPFNHGERECRDHAETCTYGGVYGLRVGQQ